MVNSVATESEHSTRQKGYLVKHSYSNDFVDQMEVLYKKYGEDVFGVQGISNKHLDLNQFSLNFFKNSKKKRNIADYSVDANANVRDTSISSYVYENGKAVMKLNSLYLLHEWVKRTFDKPSADEALEKIINGEIFVNDLGGFERPYCFAFDLMNMVWNGLEFFDGNFKVGPPKRVSSFINLVFQSTAFISNQIMGASGLPNLMPILDYYYRKEFGENYLNELPRKQIENDFQNIIYSLNWPYRGSQSPFTNVSIMDKGFCKALFGEQQFPDGTVANIDSTIELSKRFFEYYSEINGKEGMFTFPVMTIAISLDENRQYIDPEFVDWAAKANAKKGLGNIFVNSVQSFTTCCRLKNNVENINDMGYQNSFGVGSLSVGSSRVAGLNLPRIALLEKDNPNILLHDIDILHKILWSHRCLLSDYIERGSLPLYTSGWMSLNKQYSTFGFIGSYEYLVNKGLDIMTTEGQDVLVNVLKTIENKTKEYQSYHKERGEKFMANIEQIPGESMAVRLPMLDKILGFNPKNIELYSNQYIPLVENASMYDRFVIQGKFDSLTSGGAILHINVDDNQPLSETQFRKLIDCAKDTKTVYFAVNYAFSICVNDHTVTGLYEECPICQGKIKDVMTRVVGFMSPVSAWAKTRREWEFPKRYFYSNGELP
jgi:ribonucleoside-triphosphate reductase